MMTTAPSNIVGFDKFSVEDVRQDFPCLDRIVNSNPLVYFDNAATKQKPRAVLDAMQMFYENHCANVHRSAHTLSNEATAMLEAAREKVRDFINADKQSEIIFTRGTTESINLVANSFGQGFLKPGDEIIISVMEHHSNFVPWQMLRDRMGLNLKMATIAPDGNLDLDHYESLFTEKTRLVALAHVSNSLGTVNDAKKLVQIAHQNGAKILLDGCQAVAHLPVDVKDLECDFYVFSAHKMFGPTGVGVLYGKEDLLDQMPPWQGGGEMIDQVTLEKTTYADLPHKFEAGTPPIAEIIGLGAAVEYLSQFDRVALHEYETYLRDMLIERLSNHPEMAIYGTANNKVSIISFNMGDIHSSDFASIVDKEGIAVRAGHHCNQPLMQHFNIPGMVRASLCFYNTEAEIDRFGQSLETVARLFS